MMNNEIYEMIKTTINPVSGASLGDEKRFQDIAMTDLAISIVYKRDGISPGDKRAIETSIKEKLNCEPFIDKKILIKTVSDNSQDVVKGVPPQESHGKEVSPPPAEAHLKTGHVAPAPKRVLAGVDNIIAVSSCKGGVGKSTLAVNFALALKNEGKKVGLIDADIYGPSIPILLGARGKKATANSENKMMPVSAHGIQFLSFGLFIAEGEPVIWRGPMLGGVLNQFLFDADWGELDYLIIDLPPGTGDMQLSMVQTIDIKGALIVSTPQAVALQDTQKGIAMFEKVKVPIIGMVENMSYFVPEDSPEKKYYIFGQEGVRKACESTKIDFLGEIPLLTEIRLGGDEGVPYMSLNENEGTDTWKAFTQMAQTINKKLSKDEKKAPGFLGKIFS